MSEICHVGFFNLNSNCSGFNPIDLLKRALDECDQKDLFAQSLIVLPEALNIVEGYYPAPHLDTNRKCVDLEVEKKLIALSEELRLCFVVGLISSTSAGPAGYSEAVLIDARFRKVLSKKTLCDGSPCYTPFEQSPEDIVISHRGVSIAALICMDAAAGDGEDAIEKQRVRHANILKEFENHASRKILCVPARFGSSMPSAVAQSWNQTRMSIIIANWGSVQFPSALHLENGQVCLAPIEPRNSLVFAALL